MTHHALLRSLLLILALLNTASVFGHGNASAERNSAITAAAAFSYRNKGVIDPTQAWQIPGYFMGGEAMPVEKGASLDNAVIKARHPLSAHMMLQAEIATHAGSTEPALEHLWFDYYLEQNHGSWTRNLVLSAGKIPGQFSPNAAWHASSSVFSEQSLAGDVFVGRHYVDTGIQARYSANNYHLGLLLGNGDSWPGKPGDGNLVLFANRTISATDISIIGGGWVMSASVDGRQDQRYSNGHSHSGNSLSNELADIRFSGDVVTAGAFVYAQYQLGSDWRLLSELEYIAQQQQGDILDVSRKVEVDGDFAGYRAEFGVVYRHHQWRWRHEKLISDIAFSGVSPTFFAADANLISHGFEPSKNTLIWHHQISTEFATRIVMVREALYQADQQQNRFSIGFVWTQSLFTRRVD
jgi:hypothetical protein